MMTFLALLLQASAPAQEPPPPPPPLHGGPETMTCPVGGETFSAWRASMWSTYGERPDGKPYSYLTVPFPLPECPGNKLLIFARFTPAEIEKLPALLQSPHYRSMIGVEDPYYRAAWLATRLGRPAPEALHLLLTASWSGKGGSDEAPATPQSRAQARRYMSEFASRAHALPLADRPAWIDARAANALRELGRFKQAEALRKTTAARLGDKDREQHWHLYLDRLAAPIARRDASVEPLDLIPAQQVVSRCRERGRALNAFDAATCAKPEYAGKIGELNEARSRAKK